MEKAKKRKKIKETQHIDNDFIADACGDFRLTVRQRRFIFYFTWPGQDAFRCASKAAKKAGYSQAVFNSRVYKMLRDPKIQKAIEKFEKQAKATVHDAAQRFIQEKIIRADYNIKDFFDVVEAVNEKTGREYRNFKPKDPQDLTDEQLLCVDNIEPALGGSKIVFADRQKERDSIIALDATWNGKRGENDYDAEETKEIIIERVTIREAKRAKIAREDDSDIVEYPIGEIEEEL